MPVENVILYSVLLWLTKTITIVGNGNTSEKKKKKILAGKPKLQEINVYIVWNYTI